MADTISGDNASAVSRLHLDIARRIVRLLKDDNAEPGYRLVESALCERLDVSRTPIRGALKYLAGQGSIRPGATRGFVLARPTDELMGDTLVVNEEEEFNTLLRSIAKARLEGTLGVECSQQDICRMFGVFQPVAARVMRHLAELGLVERKLANGWSFGPSIDTKRTYSESYTLRKHIEPALVLLDTFVLDAEWLAQAKAAHLLFRERPWRDDMGVEFYNMNADFHDQLARQSGNRYFYLIVQRQTQLRAFRSFRWEFGPERVRDSIDEHLRIISALEEGNRPLAAHLILDHLYRAESFGKPEA